jgi:hypothetical protein
LEDGTKKAKGGYIPYAPIRKWVEDKLSVLSMEVEFSTGRARPTGRGVRQKASKLDQIAYALQRSIGQKGIKARFYMRDGLQQAGISFQRVEEGDKIVYVIDAPKYFEKFGRDIWQRISQRLGK